MNFPQELAADGNTTVQRVHPQWLGLVLTLSFLLLLASGTVSDEGCALSHLLGGWAQHYFSGGAEASQTQAQPRCRAFCSSSPAALCSSAAAALQQFKETTTRHLPRPRSTGCTWLEEGSTVHLTVRSGAYGVRGRGWDRCQRGLAVPRSQRGL